MWAIVPASVIGTSHQKTGVPCQDACECRRIGDGDNSLLLIAVADGAGSAKLSQVGSKASVQHIIGSIANGEVAPHAVTKEQAVEWVKGTILHLETVAKQEGVTSADLACTLLFGIISRTAAVFCQIGDGAWVIEKDGALNAVTWPANGEYANVTTFITTEMALDTMQFERIEGNISAVAGFTDGIQALVLEFASRQAHKPFFTHMFETVRKCTDETELIAPLMGFLASDAVLNRTDDDKTLVLACWRHPQAECHGISQ